jgi:predicted hotdog family 3-hydroxylacyl-ACP dehydratase
MMDMSWSLEDILPMRPPMVLISGVDDWSDQAITVFIDINDQAPFLEAGGVPVQIGIEYMAQACAAYSGCQARAQGHQPSIGFLLGTRNYQSVRAFFRRGERLHVIAKVEYRDEAMGMFSCEITSEGERIATAHISVYQPDDGSLPEALLNG